MLSVHLILPQGLVGAWVVLTKASGEARDHGFAQDSLHTLASSPSADHRRSHFFDLSLRIYTVIPFASLILPRFPRFPRPPDGSAQHRDTLVNVPTISEDYTNTRSNKNHDTIDNVLGSPLSVPPFPSLLGLRFCHAVSLVMIRDAAPFTPSGVPVLLGCRLGI